MLVLERVLLMVEYKPLICVLTPLSNPTAARAMKRWLFLSGKLMIGIAPRADLEPAADPAEIFVVGDCAAGAC